MVNLAAALFHHFLQVSAAEGISEITRHIGFFGLVQPRVTVLG
jgi:hypothetical protein